jgi:hypothetical protein
MKSRVVVNSIDLISELLTIVSKNKIQTFLIHIFTDAKQNYPEVKIQKLSVENT